MKKVFALAITAICAFSVSAQYTALEKEFLGPVKTCIQKEFSVSAGIETEQPCAYTEAHFNRQGYVTYEYGMEYTSAAVAVVDLDTVYLSKPLKVVYEYDTTGGNARLVRRTEMLRNDSVLRYTAYTYRDGLCKSAITFDGTNQKVKEITYAHHKKTRLLVKEIEDNTIEYTYLYDKMRRQIYKLSANALTNEETEFHTEYDEQGRIAHTTLRNGETTDSTLYFYNEQGRNYAIRYVRVDKNDKVLEEYIKKFYPDGSGVTIDGLEGIYPNTTYYYATDRPNGGWNTFTYDDQGNWITCTHTNDNGTVEWIKRRTIIYW